MHTFQGIHTIDTSALPDATYTGESEIRYTPNMAHVNDRTKIVSDNRHKTVTNIAVSPEGEGFDLLLFHALKITNDQVDEAEIVARWHFSNLEHLEFMKSLINDSVDRAHLQDL